jgi:SAM-dependent methyltransferase
MPAFRSLLYREPRLYDFVFPDAEETTGRMLRTAIARHMAVAPRSMLDIGCGTGRHLQAMAVTIPECHGVDLLESNIAYARSVRAGVTLHVGDMRTIRLGRAFDVVTCLGNALSYALTDRDLTDTALTFAAHAHADTLVAVDALNARAYLDGGGFEERIVGRVDTPEFQATSVSLHELDRTARVLKRTRTWHIAGQADVEDYAEYRLLFPEELQGLLESQGFRVVGMYDNRKLEPSDLRGRITVAADVGGMGGRKLYVFACKDARANE